jgi:hypothetical protein
MIGNLASPDGAVLCGHGVLIDKSCDPLSALTADERANRGQVVGHVAGALALIAVEQDDKDRLSALNSRSYF